MNINVSKKSLILTIINFIYCLATYISLPILALHFNLDFGLSFIQIGILLGTSPIISAFLGFMGASVSEKLGVINSLIVGLLLKIFPYLCYAYIGDFTILFLMCLVQGISRVFWEPVIKYLFTFHAKESDSQDIVFRLKYCAICLGAIVGPLIGNALSTQGKIFCLLSSAAVLFLLATVLFINKKSLDINNKNSQKKIKKISELKNCDIRLPFYILANTFVFFVFSQFETMFSLSLKELSANPEKIFSYLLILNSISGIILQIVFLFASRKIKTINYIMFGNIAFAISFIVFAFSSGQMILLVVATIIFTIGEVLVIPGGDIIIDEIAPDDKKTLYFGLAEFRLLGFSLGPIFSGIILEYFGSSMMFLFSTIIILLANVLYYFSQFLKSKRIIAAKSAY